MSGPKKRQIHFRVTDSDRRLYRAAARIELKSLSEWLRSAAERAASRMQAIDEFPDDPVLENIGLFQLPAEMVGGAAHVAIIEGLDARQKNAYFNVANDKHRPVSHTITKARRVDITAKVWDAYTEATDRIEWVAGHLYPEIGPALRTDVWPLPHWCTKTFNEILFPGAHVKGRRSGEGGLLTVKPGVKK